ncbi:DUF2188 domain-containing protein [Methanobacterium ferruginis]|jgi:MoaA/NifB/PqqE/SkfB family radical SAM enzyme|uniref:DUF2188 domain-containing protein n=1 Tax=Methanobacterium ferruginis TaxID=710191 RepID=UPI0025732EA5|nr:DUF2188 domain-containing protein [Methanobacterium ferruginis]MCC7550449.1 DUF2188 domain-containing protein [Methanobacterium sp.]BDZ68638.1 hypothetical protein GCM10025860_20860 [Methanobacterium ferruginis]
MAANIHVMMSKDGGWDVKRDGAVRASGNFETQEEAIEFAEEEGKRYSVEVFIHGEDGKIRKREAFGKKLYPG